MSDILKQAVEQAGGLRPCAKACGVTYQAVQNWLLKNRIPAERVLRLEQASGVPRTKLRPDLYPE